jgi:hypothetical protein
MGANMKRVLLPLAALAIAGLLLPTGTPPAYACSVGPDYDPIDESDGIVEGRITGWSPIENVTRWDPKTGPEPLNDPNYYGPYDPIRVHMQVERVYKGVAPRQLDVVDGASLEIYDHEPRHVWVGASGACGAFDFDPTGVYAVLGLRKDAFGRYRPSLPLVFFIGDDPEGEHYDRALERLASLAPGTLPSSGGPPPESSRFAIPLPAVATGLALLAAGSLIALRARRKA